MATDEVRVVYRKYDGALHWHQYMRRLGEDRYGVWLGAPGGTRAQRGYEEPIVVEQAHVMVFPRGLWWTAVFNDSVSRTEIYCDITTAPEWPSPENVTMVDLDLDVIRRFTGAVEVLDEDEFAEHRVKYGYPEEVVTNAMDSARWLADALTSRTEPFGTVYVDWLRHMT